MPPAAPTTATLAAVARVEVKERAAAEEAAREAAGRRRAANMVWVGGVGSGLLCCVCVCGGFGLCGWAGVVKMEKEGTGVSSPGWCREEASKGTRTQWGGLVDVWVPSRRVREGTRRRRLQNRRCGVVGLGDGCVSSA